MIDYRYNDFIKDINNGNLKSIMFSIKNYSHYKRCVIQRVIEPILYGRKQLVNIVINLVEDNSEKVSFLNTFKEDYKLFKFGRNGTFTLKQVWKKVVIQQIIYNIDL